MPQGARAKRTQNIEGDWHPSAEEAEWFNGLIRLQRAGIIRDLKREPSYRIDGPKTGTWICNVKADASYFDTRDHEHHVVDWKGRKGDTAVSRLKHRLVEEFHGVKIELVGKYVERKAKDKAKRATERALLKRSVSRPATKR